MQKISPVFVILFVAIASIFGVLWFVYSLNLPMLMAKDGSTYQELPGGTLSLIIAIGAILSMLVGLYHIFARLKEKNAGFSQNSLKALSVILFIPALLLISIQKDFASEALAALLGTVAGYVLSNSRDSNKDT